MATPASATTAVAKIELTPEAYTAALRNAGMIEAERQSNINRAEVDGLTFHLGDEMFVSNPKTGAPAFLALLTDTPIEYQAKWFDENGNLARLVGRPHIKKSFCKSFFDNPNQAREKAEDGTSCKTCPVHPFIPKDQLPAEAENQKCSWRGDVNFRVLNAEGLIEDQTVWTLSLPTTGMIEFKGTSKEPERGHTDGYNFMQRLVRLGAESNPENPDQGIGHALTSLRLGGIVAEVRSVPVQSQDGGRRYNVTQFIPIAIHDVEQPTAALAEGGEYETEDLPF